MISVINSDSDWCFEYSLLKLSIVKGSWTNITYEAERNNTLLNHISELYFLLGPDAEKVDLPQTSSSLAITEIPDDDSPNITEIDEIPLTEKKFPPKNENLGNETKELNSENSQKNKALAKTRTLKCYECGKIFYSEEDLINHYSPVPLKYFRGPTFYSRTGLGRVLNFSQFSPIVLLVYKKS